MAEEIKEILDRFNKGHDELTVEEYILLENYITNLQQENKAKTHQIEVLEEIVNYERNIRNAKLQQDLDKANDIIQKDRQFYKCRMDEYVDYKSRFEKANTYINEEIKKIQEHQYSTGVRRLNKIQNILNGVDENE